MEFDYWTLAYLLFPLPLAVKVATLPFPGPQGIHRSRRTYCRGGGTGPTHEEGVLGTSAKKFSSQSYSSRKALAPFLGYRNSDRVSPGPLYTVSLMVDERLKISPSGLEPNTLHGGIVGKENILYIVTWHSLFGEQT